MPRAAVPVTAPEHPEGWILPKPQCEWQSLPSVIHGKVASFTALGHACILSADDNQGDTCLGRFAWHAVQQGMCSWIHSSMAAFKYLAGERAGIAVGLAESPSSRAPGSECTWTWEGLRNIVLSQ